VLHAVPRRGRNLSVDSEHRGGDHHGRNSGYYISSPGEAEGLGRPGAAFAESRTIAAQSRTVKGGLSVDVGVRAFMPASRSGVREMADLEKLVGQEIQCKIIKVDVADEDVVVDRRAVLEEEERRARQKFRRAGRRRRDEDRATLTDFGAFSSGGHWSAARGRHIWGRVASRRMCCGKEKPTRGEDSEGGLVSCVTWAW
jgi:hypothetical protein